MCGQASTGAVKQSLFTVRAAVSAGYPRGHLSVGGSRTDAVELVAMAFGKSADSSQALHLLQRYKTALHRQYSRALNNLRKVRADKTLHRPTTQETPINRPKPSRSLNNLPVRRETRFSHCEWKPILLLPSSFQ